MCAAEWRVEWYGCGFPSDAIRSRTGRNCIGEGVRVRRDEERELFVILSGAGCKEFGVGGADSGGEGGRAGEDERFIERLSRVSSLTSSIRDKRLRCGVGEGELVARKSSRSSSMAFGGSSALRNVSRGLLDRERDLERRASSRRALAAPLLGIASTVDQISGSNLRQGERATSS